MSELRDLRTQHLVSQQPLTREQVEAIVAGGEGKMKDYEERLPGKFWHSSFPSFPEGWAEETGDYAVDDSGGETVVVNGPIPAVFRFSGKVSVPNLERYGAEPTQYGDILIPEGIALHLANMILLALGKVVS